MAATSIRALNLYYARTPELREQVLATRLRASDVRAQIGIPRGRVLRRIEGDAEAPDVMWDCPFADVAGHERDMDARAASAEFEAVRAHMRSMLRRFGRVLYQVVRNTPQPDALDRDASLIQLWLECPPDAARNVQARLAEIPELNAVRMLRRHGDDAALPMWILEPGPHDAARSQRALELACGSFPETRVRRCTWERCA